jgi:hypothetical protein
MRLPVIRFTRATKIAALSTALVATVAVGYATTANAAVEKDFKFHAVVDVSSPKPPTLTLGTVTTHYVNLQDDKGKKIGTGSVSCNITKLLPPVPPTPANPTPQIAFTNLCNEVFHLPKGDLLVTTEFNLNPNSYPIPVSKAVIGGTGEYSGASGTADVVINSVGTFDLDVHLN